MNTLVIAKNSFLMKCWISANKLEPSDYKFVHHKEYLYGRYSGSALLVINSYDLREEQREWLREFSCRYIIHKVYIN